MQALAVVERIADHGIEGVGPLSSAEELAREYLNNGSYSTDDERIDALIRWETSKNFGSGFLTSLGGLITLPAAVPAALGASCIIAARMSAAIAIINGHDVHGDRVRTFVSLTLLGDAAVKEVLREAGIKIGRRATLTLIRRIPDRVLIEINKKIGFRLLTKAGEKGVVNLSKAVPFIGGFVGGTVDAVACQAVGKIAKQIFAKGKQTDLPRVVGWSFRNEDDTMKETYTAVVKRSGPWWIGWIEEIPGVNCQERTKAELLTTLKLTLQEALEFNHRREVREAAGEGFEKAAITV